MNPGGSIKDRAALYVIKDAEEKGLIKPGVHCWKELLGIRVLD